MTTFQLWASMTSPRHEDGEMVAEMQMPNSEQKWRCPFSGVVAAVTRAYRPQFDSVVVPPR